MSVLLHSVKMRPVSEHDNDPAAALTASIGRWLHVGALVIFPIVTAICIVILASGSADQPARVAFIAAACGLASTAAFFNRRQTRRYAASTARPAVELSGRA